MARVIPVWDRPDFCPHPSNGRWIRGPYDCAWCGKSQAGVLLVSWSWPFEPFRPEPRWRRLVKRVVQVSARRGPGIGRFTLESVFRWFVHEGLAWLVDKVGFLSKFLVLALFVRWR